MQIWQPGARLLSDFEIKIGRLSANMRRKQLTETDIIRACRVTDDAIARLIKHRKDHDNEQRPTDRRRVERDDRI